MKIEAFQAGMLRTQYHYSSFSPNLINHGWIWEDATVNILLEEATRYLSELNAFAELVPDVDLFIQMHIAKEAQTSSRIEGTRTAMDEVVMDKEQLEPEKRDDWQEVQNYITAMNTATVMLDTLPLSNRLLQDTHKILMDGVRGNKKFPGEFRRSQNWIGGTSLQDAVFIPPHHNEIAELMSDLDLFRQ